MSDVSEQAKALADVQWGPGNSANVRFHAAQRAVKAGWVHRDSLVAEGWTPPPDPCETIARSVWLFLFPGGEWLAPEFESQRNLVQHMREVFTADEARAIAGRIEGEP